MPLGKPAGTPPKQPKAGLIHTGYSVIAGDPEKYQGRPLINSRSEQIQGGVFYPKSMEGHMEAITVDYENDQPLKAYIDEMDQHILKINREFHQSGRQMTLAIMLSVISHKIAADFPYSVRMTEGDYLKKSYKPGTKYALGYIMGHQDMVCRHMGLLVGAILDHLKENARKGTPPGIKPDTEVRFMADRQKDLVENVNSGHGYVVLKRWDEKEKKNLYYVVDPTGGIAVEIRDIFNKKREKSPGAHRYLFSTLRFLFQKEDPKDEKFLENVFARAKAEVAVLEVLKDLRQTLTDVDAIRRFEKLRIRQNLQGIL